MTFDIAYGPPGCGKGQYGAYVSRKCRKKGREVYANYSLDDTRRLYDLRDVVARGTRFSGAQVILDEIQDYLNARDTLSIDKLVAMAITQHRHNGGVDLLGLTPHPRFVDITIRSLARAFICIERVGPAGDDLARSERDRPLPAIVRYCSWVFRPWFFRWTAYDASTFDVDSLPGDEVAPGRVLASGIFLFSQRRAESYDSWEELVPFELRDRYEEQMRGARVRAEVPRQRVVRGRLQRTALPEGFAFLPPPVMIPRKNEKRLVPSAQQLLEDGGYFTHEEHLALMARQADELAVDVSPGMGFASAVHVLAIAESECEGDVSVQ